MSAEESETGIIARLAAPISLAHLGMTAIGLVDVAILGHASSTDLGGAALGRAVCFAAVAFGIGVASAVEALAAQALGAKEPDVAWRIYIGALVACVLVWLPTSLLAASATWLFGPIGVDPALIAPARAFLLPQLPGMLGYSVFLTGKSFLQAHGRTAPALHAALAANVLNLVVCNLLVRGDEVLLRVGLTPLGLPPLGAFGAGVASSISMLFLAGWMLVAALRFRPVPASVRTKTARTPLVRVLRLGGPIGLQLLAEIGVFTLVAVLAGKLGTVAASAHQVAIGLATFSFMGALGISGATAVRVGHAVGEGRSPTRAGRSGLVLGLGYMAITATIFLVARRPLAALFAEDPAVVDLGARLLVVAAGFQLFDGVQAVAAGALRGAADVRIPFLANVGAHWLVGFPLALWLSFGLGLGAEGLWLGLLVGLALVSMLLSWRFFAIARGPIARA